MTRPANTPLTPEIASEVCQRSQSKAYVSGTIASMGSKYAVGLKPVNCQNGDVLAKSRHQKKKVIEALGDGAARLRRELAESLASIQKYDVPLEQATTSSLEALKNYLMGIDLEFENDFASRDYWLRAVELDPNFARAYAALAVNYSNHDEMALARRNGQRAYELRDRCTERERLTIHVRYYRLVTGEVEKLKAIDELYVRTYPQDPLGLTNLAMTHMMLGEYRECLGPSLQSIKHSPTSLSGHHMAMLCYVGQNRLADAKSVFQQAVAQNAGTQIDLLYHIAFLENNTTEMERQLAAMESKGWRPASLPLRAGTAAFHGKIGGARRLSRISAEAAKQSGDRTWRSRTLS